MINVQPPPAANLSPIALVAGRGILPATLVDVFRSQNRPFVILAFNDQVDPAFVSGTSHIWLSFGEIGKALNYMKMNGVKDIVMAGTMTRPRMSDIHPDWVGVKWMAKIGVRSIGDDGFLRAIIGMLEEQGYRVVGPDEIVEDLLSSKGDLTALSPDEQPWGDIDRGIEVPDALSAIDVGQAVVVQDGLVLGVEAAEGTDGLLRRVKDLQRPGRGGTLIKMAKRNQESRADLPTIGPETVKAAQAAGLRGIVIEAGSTLLLNREETVQLAEKAGLFLYGFKHTQCTKKHP